MKRSTKSSKDKGAASPFAEDSKARETLLQDIVTRNTDKSLGYISYPGILPLDLPDGTKIVVLPDIHVPAHDKLVMKAVKRFLRDYRPHILIFIGDVADCFDLSRWGKQPHVAADMQYELDETRRVVDGLVKASGCFHAFYVMGNHEDRLYRYLKDPASKVAGIVDFHSREPIMTFHSLMGYGKEDNVTFLYDLDERSGYGGGVRINGDMEFHHGYIVRPKPGASPLADADKLGRSVTHGHTHRLGMAVRNTTKEVIRAYELGHLVNPAHAYFGYSNLLNNWHPGIGVATVVGGRVHLQPVPIKQVEFEGLPRYTMTFGGQVYRASDR